MTKDEADQIVATLIVYFGELPGQPDWKRVGTIPAWHEMLSPFSMLDGIAAVNSLRTHIAEKIDDPTGRAYFPIIDEFGNYLRKVATQRERDAITRGALESHILCDGSRWIDNEPNQYGERPWPDKGPGMVPCPTCNPSNYAAWAGGRQHDRLDVKGQPKPPPACRYVPEQLASHAQAAAHIEEARRIVSAMSPDSPMKTALEHLPWNAP